MGWHIFHLRRASNAFRALWVSLLLTMAGLILTGCGSSDCEKDCGSSSPSKSKDDDKAVVSYTNISGRLMDGYLTGNGLTLCLDNNANDVCDTGEPKATINPTNMGLFANTGLLKSQCVANARLLIIVPTNTQDATLSRSTTAELPYRALCADVDSNNFIVVSPLTTYRLESDSIRTAYQTLWDLKLSGVDMKQNFIANNKTEIQYLAYWLTTLRESKKNGEFNSTGYTMEDLLSNQFRLYANDVLSDDDFRAGKWAMADVATKFNNYTKDRLMSNSAKKLVTQVDYWDDVAISAVPAALYEVAIKTNTLGTNGTYCANSGVTAPCQLVINKINFSYNTTTKELTGVRVWPIAILGSQARLNYDLLLKKNTTTKNDYRLSVQTGNEDFSYDIGPSLGVGFATRLYKGTLKSPMSADTLTGFLQTLGDARSIGLATISCSAGLINTGTVIYRLVNHDGGSKQSERYFLSQTTAQVIVNNCTNVGTMINTAGTYSYNETATIAE